MAGVYGDRDRFLERIKETVDYCYRLGTSDFLATENRININLRLDQLTRDIDRSIDTLLTREGCDFKSSIVKLKEEILARNENQEEGAACYKADKVKVDEKGHCKYDITKDQLQFFTKYGLTAPMMSDVLGVSESTIRRRLRWGFVIHGCIDGFSRMVTFITSSTNNKALTVFDKFIDATKEYGLPSRIRCDHGVENVNVCLYMEHIRGAGRGSAIKGKSPHNQRIERLWVDVWDNTTSEFYDLFMYIENEDILDISNSKHIFALHYVFQPRINESLKTFQFQYNNHPLSTEHNKTPSQLFIMGIMANANGGKTSIQELISNAGEPSLHQQDVDLETYGVGTELQDSEGEDNDNNMLDNASFSESIINNDVLEQLKEDVNPLENISCKEYGVELFKKALTYEIDN